MPKYRKKPVVIEAVQFKEIGRTPCKYGDHVEYNTTEISNFMNDIVKMHTFPGERPEGLSVLVINTLEGEMQASVGDYIIKGVKGEFYPCKPDIFDATYEPVDSAKATLYGSMEANRKEIL